MDQKRRSTESDRITWLADQIFNAFPNSVTGLNFYILDCGCIYYRRKFRDGKLESKAGIYRDAQDGPCEKCMVMDGSWEERVVDEMVFYNTKFQVN